MVKLRPTPPPPQMRAQLYEKLRAAGLRATRQRMALGLLLLGAGARHVSAEALHREAAASGLKVSLTTVYNTLHRFTDAGLLREVIVPPNHSWFDTNTSDHHHFYYRDENRLEDIPAERVRLEGLPTPAGGGRIHRVDVMIHVEAAPG